MAGCAELLRSLSPDIVHTRNLGTLEYLVPAAFFGIRGRIHGEHGRDVYDPDGLNFKYNLLRRAIRPFVHQYIAVSDELTNWLVQTVGVRRDRVQRICNGVDVERFRLRTEPRANYGPQGFASSSQMIVGTVGRVEAIKDQLTLVRAFLHLINIDADARARLRLTVIGDGALREEARQLISAAGAEFSRLVSRREERHPGTHARDGSFCFAFLAGRNIEYDSRGDGDGLPVVATRVGGNPELVVEGETGTLVPPSDPVAMADAIQSY